MATKKQDYPGWAVGGGSMLGLGVGFFFLQASILWFVGCIIGGIGLGLIVGSLIGPKK